MQRLLWITMFAFLLAGAGVGGSGNAPKDIQELMEALEVAEPTREISPGFAFLCASVCRTSPARASYLRLLQPSRQHIRMLMFSRVMAE
jgi:hypothetical protein